MTAPSSPSFSQRAVDVVFRSVVATLPLELRTALTSSGLDDPGIFLAYLRTAEDELRALCLGISARSTITPTFTTHPSFSPSLVPSTVPIDSSLLSPGPGCGFVDLCRSLRGNRRQVVRLLLTVQWSAHGTVNLVISVRFREGLARRREEGF